MRNYTIIFFLSLVIFSCSKDYNLKTVSVKEFKEFINATGYITSAEQYGWSFVQQDVYDYKIVNGANWLKPDGINLSADSLPVTQVSYNDAIEYCKWAGVSLPTYYQYWELVSSDDRLIVSDNMYPISSVESVKSPVKHNAASQRDFVFSPTVSIATLRFGR